MHERFIYDPFVLPFTIGFVFIIAYLIGGLLRTIKHLPATDRTKLFKHVFSVKIFSSIREIFMECLLHRKIFKRNKMLGFMHMSIAFGWFLIIVLGHIECRLFVPERISVPYFPIFFRYFVAETSTSLKGSLLFFLMDASLLLILIGIGMAFFKRINSKRLGMRRTTKLKWADRIALYSLWAIFPLRLLAESFTAHIAGDSFLTKGFGLLFSTFINNEAMMWPTWMAYSTALGVFFFALPFSRYMHIPTEILLIVLRNAGIKANNPEKGYAMSEIYSCSRCGICIDACQMTTTPNLEHNTSVYFIRALRHHQPIASEIAQKCMLCSRCVAACPVGIDSTTLKSYVREKQNKKANLDYSYLKPTETITSDILYFAGCMTQTTPAISKAIHKIFTAANIRYQQMDKTETICCGRPLMLLGQTEAAQQLMQKNKEIIKQSKARLLVTSCPICYKVFHEEYNLPISVLHHTQYFEKLMDVGLLNLNKDEQLSAVFHDPCDLGRASGIYDAPRRVLNASLNLNPLPENTDKEHAYCCGASLANTTLTQIQRTRIAQNALTKMTVSKPDLLVTACPLCKKTFANIAQTKVEDIAEVVARSIAS